VQYHLRTRRVVQLTAVRTLFRVMTPPQSACSEPLWYALLPKMIVSGFKTRAMRSTVLESILRPQPANRSRASLFSGNSAQASYATLMTLTCTSNSQQNSCSWPPSPPLTSQRRSTYCSALSFALSAQKNSRVFPVMCPPLFAGF
jgi:hypothetical protein